jgi:hypothetical protein
MAARDLTEPVPGDDEQARRKAFVMAAIIGGPHTSELIAQAVVLAEGRCDETADAEAKAQRDVAHAEAKDLQACRAVLRKARAMKARTDRVLAQVRRYEMMRRYARDTNASDSTTSRRLVGPVRRHDRGRATRTSQRRTVRARAGSRTGADPHERVAALAGGAR